SYKVKISTEFSVSRPDTEEARAVKPGKPGKPAPAKVAPKAGSAKIKTETKAKRDVESNEDSDDEARPLAKSKRKVASSEVEELEEDESPVKKTTRSDKLEEDESPVKKTTRSDKLKDKEPEKELEKKVLSAKERARIKMRPRPEPEPRENEPQQIADSEASNQILAKSPSKLKKPVVSPEAEGPDVEDLSFIDFKPSVDGVRVVKATKMIIQAPISGSVASRMRQKTKQ
ncbi:hypothetical protein RSAG8_12650, partial [Rhizoctonia solani AG-8 WAC10335]